jgi:hypothetical protein
MVSSVRDCICTCQAGCPRTQFRLIALLHAGASLKHVVASQGVLLVVVLSLILLAALVVFPAVWSSDKERRKAAFAVLKLLIGGGRDRTRTYTSDREVK